MLSFGAEKEKEEVGNDVEDALEENFDKHDKIAKIHTGVDMDEGLSCLVEQFLTFLFQRCGGVRGR